MDQVPGGSARVVIEPGIPQCTVERVTSNGNQSFACDEIAYGPRAVEARVDLAQLDLAGPVQVNRASSR